MTRQHYISVILVVSIFTFSLSPTSQVFADSGTQHPDDASITARIKEAFFEDTDLKITFMNIHTTDGIVQQEGVVDSDSKKLDAINVATDIKEAEEVTDDLAIRVTDDY